MLKLGLILIAFAAVAYTALLIGQPETQFTMTQVDDYWLYRDIIPAQVRAASEGEE